MNSKFNAKWSLTVKIITVVVAIIMIIAETTLIRQLIAGYCNFQVFLGIFIIAFAFIFPLMAPIYICLSDNNFILKKVIGKKVIPFDEIINIQKFTSSGDIRVFGSGGYGGYLGIFSNAQIGKYSAYVGDFSQAFLIQLKNNKNYVFSCENGDLVIETIKNKIL
jgi:hypothetical protein